MSDSKLIQYELWRSLSIDDPEVGRDYSTAIVIELPPGVTEEDAADSIKEVVSLEVGRLMISNGVIYTVARLKERITLEDLDRQGREALKKARRSQEPVRLTEDRKIFFAVSEKVHQP